MVRELNMDWLATIKAAFIAFFFGRFGATGWGRVFLYAMVPAVFFVQLRKFRLYQKVVWEYLALSKLNSGWLFGLISAPQQVLLTYDDDKFDEEVYQKVKAKALEDISLEGEEEEGGVEEEVAESAAVDSGAAAEEEEESEETVAVEGEEEEEKVVEEERVEEEEEEERGDESAVEAEEQLEAGEEEAEITWGSDEEVQQQEGEEMEVEEPEGDE